MGTWPSWLPATSIPYPLNTAAAPLPAAPISACNNHGANADCVGTASRSQFPHSIKKKKINNEDLLLCVCLYIAGYISVQEESKAIDNMEHDRC